MGKIYGYCKNSLEFSLKEQVKEITKDYKYIQVIRDTKKSNDNLKRLINKLNNGDKVVFFSILQISNDYNECFDTYKNLLDNKVEIKFIKEPYLNTEVFKNSTNENNFDENYDLIINIIKEQIILEYTKYKKNSSNISFLEIFFIAIIANIINSLLYHLFGIKYSELVSLTIYVLSFFIYFYVSETLNEKKISNSKDNF